MSAARTLSAIFAMTGAIVLTQVASASAASVTYRNDATIFNPVSFSSPGVSQITVPAGRTPIAKVEVPGVRISAANPNGLDADLTLAGPGGPAPALDLLSDACSAYNGGTTLDFADGAATTVGTSCSGPVRPEDSRALSSFNGSPSSGTWTARITDDNGAAGTDISFLGWGLFITHAPFSCTASAPKQGLRTKLKLRASCNANARVRSGGDVKAKKLTLAQNVTSQFKLPLKESALERLAGEGGFAKVKLRAKDGYGDKFVFRLKLTIPD